MRPLLMKQRRGWRGARAGAPYIATLLITQCRPSSLVQVVLRKSFVARLRLLRRSILIRKRVTLAEMYTHQPNTSARRARRPRNQRPSPVKYEVRA
ncbi:hypothetical protein EVAR_37188_1 [Eumeta japonica]|uniref:Uncharacterized protein n=1 Tax=Eumeta variegata TaxID=151549 RepID=A0A4C1WJK8_EUMVA|nr:hypothetical protein EVAR_37188_1 [Eumeta japonica]